MIKLSLSFLSILIMFFFLHTVTGAPLPTTGGSGSDYTMTNIILLIVFILISIVFSFLCSIAEAALLNITPSYIADLHEKKPKFAKKIQKLRQDEIDQSLAAILTMNTIAHTVGAIVSGAQAAIVFGSFWVGIFSIFITLLILFVSEIIPKTIGVIYWRQLIKPVILYIELLIKSLKPFIVVSEGLTKLIAKDKQVQIFNRDEFIAMAGVGEETGEIDYQESRILQNLFKLGSLTAKDIFTPRTVMMGFEENTTVNDILDNNDKFPFSRLITYKEDIDNITGFILKDDILLLKAQNKGETKISTIVRDIKAVPLNIPLTKLLEFFLQNRQHIAIVVDEFGTKGLVSVEDVLETLLGMEIVDESDSVVDMQVLARQMWQKRIKSLGLEWEKKEAEKIDTEKDLEQSDY
jgi:CBS domain containing-hemolysin-like protein